MNNTREWLVLTPETVDHFEAILGKDLIQAKIKSLVDTKQDYPMVKMIAGLSAVSLRKASILAPGIIPIDEYDLYGYNGIRFILYIQDGVVISAYQENY